MLNSEESDSDFGAKDNKSNESVNENLDEEIEGQGSGDEDEGEGEGEWDDEENFVRKNNKK
jgi:hypothetical protein